MAFSIITLNIKELKETLGIKEFIIMSLCWVSLCWLSFLLIVMLCVIMLSIVMLSVIRLNVVWLSLVAPSRLTYLCVKMHLQRQMMGLMCMWKWQWQLSNCDIDIEMKWNEMKWNEMKWNEMFFARFVQCHRLYEWIISVSVIFANFV